MKVYESGYTIREPQSMYIIYEPHTSKGEKREVIMNKEIDDLIKWLREKPIKEYCLRDTTLKNKLKELKDLLNNLELESKEYFYFVSYIARNELGQDTNIGDATFEMSEKITDKEDIAEIKRLIGESEESLNDKNIILTSLSLLN